MTQDEAERYGAAAPGQPAAGQPQQTQPQQTQPQQTKTRGLSAAEAEAYQAPTTGATAPLGWGEWLGHEAGIIGSAIAHTPAALADLPTRPGAEVAPDPALEASRAELQLPKPGDPDYQPSPWATPATRAVDLIPGLVGTSWAQPKNLGERLLYAGTAGGTGGFLTGGLSLVPTIAGAGAGVGSAGAHEVQQSLARENPDSWIATPDAELAAQLVGGYLGGAGTSLATQAVGGLARGGYQLGRVATEPGRQTVAVQQFRRASATTPEELETGLTNLPLPGLQPTVGDLGDRGAAILQRAVEAHPEIGEAPEIATANNKVIRGAFDDVGPHGGREDYEISRTAAPLFRTIANNQRQAASGAFEALPSDVTMVQVAPLRAAYQNYVEGGVAAGGITQARRRFLPDTYQKLLEGYGDEEPLAEIQDFNSALGNDAAAARRSGDNNRANALEGLQQAMFPNGGPEGLLPPAAGTVGDDLRAARAQWQRYAETYRQPDAVRTVLQRDAPDSEMLDTLLGPGGGGQSERAAQFYAAAQGNEPLLRQARAWFAARMLRAGATGGLDAEDNPMLSGYRLGRFQERNQPLIDSPIFDVGQRQQIDNIVRGASLVQRTARAGARAGSDTYRNQVVGGMLDDLGFGPVAGLVEAAAPTLVASGVGHLIGGPTGAVIGGLAGRNAIEGVFTGARRGVQKVLGDAMHDPQLMAAALRRVPQRATPAAPPALTPATLAPYGFWRNVPRVGGRALQSALVGPIARGAAGGTLASALAAPPL
jgi:hypothetical protein